MSMNFAQRENYENILGIRKHVKTKATDAKTIQIIDISEINDSKQPRGTENIGVFR